MGFGPMARSSSLLAFVVLGADHAGVLLGHEILAGVADS